MTMFNKFQLLEDDTVRIPRKHTLVLLIQRYTLSLCYVDQLLSNIDVAKLANEQNPFQKLNADYL